MTRRRLLLPADDEHPARLNVAIIRHLTYDEVHAAQLGLAGLPIGAAYANGLTEVSVWFTLALLGIVFGVTVTPDTSDIEDENKTDGARASREVITIEPWYFLTSYFAWVAVGIMAARFVFPPPTLPGTTPTLTASILTALTSTVLAFVFG